MTKVAVVFAEGFEEIEALSPVDVFRRAGFDCSMIGLESTSVTGSHGIQVAMDGVFDGNYKKIIPSENAKLISPTPSKNNKKDSDTTYSTGDDTTAEELDAFVDEDVADEYEDYDDIAYVILYPRLTTVSVTINK